MNTLSIIEDFKKKEKKYDKFYRKDVTCINVCFVYINLQNEIVHVKKEKKHIQDNLFSQYDFLKMLKNNKQLFENSFYFDKCIQYNFSLEPDNIQNYFNHSEKFDFLHVYNYSQDIFFEKTIQFFDHLNSIYFLFKEEKKSTGKNSKNKTRKVYYSVKKAGSTNSGAGKKRKNKTKKVTFNPIFTLE